MQSSNLCENVAYKVSIVMAYYNRKSQLMMTLETIRRSECTNFEVIIVDDGSSDAHRLNDIIYNYPFKIKLLRIEPEDKQWINPCVAYNLGLKHASGEIIIIQNPEICHIGDVIKYTINNLKNDQYFSYSCYALPDQVHNRKFADVISKSKTQEVLKKANEYMKTINYENYRFDWKFYVSNYPDLKDIITYEKAWEHWETVGNLQKRKCNKMGQYQPNEYIEWHGWYNHPIHHPRPLHFLSATKRKNIEALKGFNQFYKSGYWYDDDDFLERMKLIAKVSIISPNEVCGIHLYHDNGSSDQIKDRSAFNKLCQVNRILYDKLKGQIKKRVPNIHDWNPTNAETIQPKYHEYKNYLPKNIIIGLGITTYSDAKTPKRRIEIINESFESLKRSLDKVAYKIIVTIVVDGNCTVEHKNILKKYSNIFQIIYKARNSGIGGAKNTCIKSLLDQKVDVGFIADDDVLYKANWYKPYCSYILGSNIQHFMYVPAIYIPPAGSLDANYVNHNLHKIINFKYVMAGCFCSFTKKLIDKIGYFKVLPYRYGHEHGDFTERCIKSNMCPGRVDIYESFRFLELHPDSIKIKSIQVDYDQVEKNAQNVKSSDLYVKFCDMPQ